MINVLIEVTFVPCSIGQNSRSLEGGAMAVGRADPAACCIQYEEGRPQLLVTGGVDRDDKTLSDAWLLDVNPGSWKEVGRH